MINFEQEVDKLSKQIIACEDRKRRRHLGYKLSAYVLQKGRCVFCSREMYACSREVPNTKLLATIEHKHPKSQGGVWTKENIVASCYSCNRWRSDIDYDAFEYLCASFDYPKIKRITGELMRRNLKTFNGVVDYLFTVGYKL